uniref:HNH endonuclease n=1 Tax=viral metagenome TaxID=1070528 RepID=A0A6C0B0A1_9ZZZZ
MEEKKIIIHGTGNRYQVNKLTRLSNEPKMKKQVKISPIPDNFYEVSIQPELVKELYNKTELSFTKPYLHVLNEIEKKVASYKQQDILKKRFNKDIFIKPDEVLLLLYDSSMKCHYCSQGTVLLYTIAREMTQWTLDRIDNNIGHNTNNVVISCLDCNLKRRRQNQDAFLFTQQLSIVKMDE